MNAEQAKAAADLVAGMWENEHRATCQVHGAVKDDNRNYRPDPKSRTAKEIAWQIVCEEQMIIAALETGKVEWAPPPMPATMRDIVAAYDEQAAGMEARWNALSDERWNGALDFFGSSRPASAMAWSLSTFSSRICWALT